MSWNGSDNKVKVIGEGEKRSDKFHHSSLNTQHSSLKHGALAGLAVIALGCAALYYFTRHNQLPTDQPTDQPTTPTAIAEVAPDIETNTVEEAPPPPREMTEAEKTQDFIKKCEARYGADMPPGLKTYIYYLKHPPKRIFGGDDKYPYLKHPCEKHLASFLNIKPGAYFIQCPEFDESFDSDFIEAARNPLTIDAKDSDEVKEVKRALNDMKDEIMEICKKDGKLPSQVMNEHAMSLFNLGKYQQDMQEHLDEIYNSPKYSDSDVKDFCKAANQMLEENGLDPLPYPDLTERTLELQYNLEHSDNGDNDQQQE